MAARLQGLAESGGLCISAAARDQLPSKLKLDCEDQGEQQVKNIPEPVRAYRVRVGAGPAQVESRSAANLHRAAAGILALVVIAAFVVGYWWVTRGGAPDVATARSGPPALAVLPFQELSGDPEQEYFADGISQDLTTRLSQVLSLGGAMARRRARRRENSTLVYQGQAVSVEQVGRELGVRYVVEGSVRRRRGARAHHGPADRRHHGPPRLGADLRSRLDRPVRGAGRDQPGGGAGRGRRGRPRRDGARAVHLDEPGRLGVGAQGSLALPAHDQAGHGEGSLPVRAGRSSWTRTGGGQSKRFRARTVSS